MHFSTILFFCLYSVGAMVHNPALKQILDSGLTRTGADWSSMMSNLGHVAYSLDHMGQKRPGFYDLASEESK